MKRKIIHIDEEKCNGCGACASACHEGAIGMVNGKAKLLRDDYCDGFGDCLPACPMNAISFTEREALAYNEQAVEENKKRLAAEKEAKRTEKQCAKAQEAQESHAPAHGGCPGHRLMQFHREKEAIGGAEQSKTTFDSPHVGGSTENMPSRLSQFPCQIRLLPASAPCFENAKILIAADCTAYAYANTHEKFMKGRITLIGCPKLDDFDYETKLTQIFSLNDIKSVTVLRMEVPCCGGLQRAAENALKNSGKFVPWQVITISTGGRIIDES